MPVKHFERSSKSKPAEAPLSYRKLCSWNASPVIHDFLTSHCVIMSHICICIMYFSTLDMSERGTSLFCCIIYKSWATCDKRSNHFLQIQQPLAFTVKSYLFAASASQRSIMAPSVTNPARPALLFQGNLEVRGKERCMLRSLLWGRNGMSTDGWEDKDKRVSDGVMMGETHWDNGEMSKLTTTRRNTQQQNNNHK